MTGKNYGSPAPWALDQWSATGNLIPQDLGAAAREKAVQKEQLQAYHRANRERYDGQLADQRERRRLERLSNRDQELKVLGLDKEMRAQLDAEEQARKTKERSILRQREAAMRAESNRKKAARAERIQAERIESEQVAEQIRLQTLQEHRQREVKRQEYQRVMSENEARIARLQEEKAREVEYEKKLQREYEERVEAQERARRQQYEQIAARQQNNQQRMMKMDGWKSEATIRQEEAAEMKKLHADAVKKAKEDELHELREREEKNAKVKAVLDSQMSHKREMKIAKALEARQLALKYKEEAEAHEREKQRQIEQMKEKQRKIREQLLDQMREQKQAREKDPANNRNFLDTRQLKYQHQRFPGQTSHGPIPQPEPTPARHTNNSQSNTSKLTHPMLATRALPTGTRPRSSSGGPGLSRKEAEMMQRICAQHDTRAERVISSLSHKGR